MAKTEFDAVGYITALLERNKLYKQHEFHFSTAPSIGDMADMVYESRDYANHFVCIDTSTSNIQMQRGGGYFERKQFTFFLLMRFEPGDEQDRMAKRTVCRELQRQVISYILHDGEKFSEEDLQFFDTENIMSQELSDFMLNGLTGLWFIFNLDMPKDLHTNASDWD